MPDAPDPLGKRALFWAPAERQETGPRRPEERIAPGRHALFSGGFAAPAKAAKKTAAVPAARGPVRRSPALVGTKRAPALTGTKPASVRPVRPARVKAVPVKSPPPPERHGHGPISLSCSKCGIHTDVDILKFVRLHLPWWMWRPGRGYTNLMKCPACKRRAWVSASWGPGEH